MTIFLPPTCAACRSKILQLGIRLFAGVSLLVLATVLPVNLTGGQVRMGGYHCRACGMRDGIVDFPGQHASARCHVSMHSRVVTAGCCAYQRSRA